MSEGLPEIITATRQITYVVGDIADSMRSFDYDPTLDEVIALIKEYACEDLACGHGHHIDEDEITFDFDYGAPTEG